MHANDIPWMVVMEMDREMEHTILIRSTLWASEVAMPLCQVLGEGGNGHVHQRSREEREDKTQAIKVSEMAMPFCLLFTNLYIFLEQSLK